MITIQLKSKLKYDCFEEDPEKQGKYSLNSWASCQKAIFL